MKSKGKWPMYIDLVDLGHIAMPNSIPSAERKQIMVKFREYIKEHETIAPGSFDTTDHRDGAKRK